MRGRKPIPTDLHKLRGTLNTTRHGKGRTGEPEAWATCHRSRRAG